MIKKQIRRQKGPEHDNREKEKNKDKSICQQK